MTATIADVAPTVNDETGTTASTHNAIAPRVPGSVATATIAASARQGGAAQRVSTVIDLLRTRVPFTASVTVVMLLAGLFSGGLWDSVADRSWYPDLAYGLPSLESGAWWTLVTGTLFAMTPAVYLPMVGSFVLMVGFAEWRLGSRIAGVAAVTGQLIGTAGAALVLSVARNTDWTWARESSQHLDVGFSAGALAALAVVSAVLRGQWRLRLRLALLCYVGVAFLLIGSLADLEHLIAVAIAMPLAPLLLRQSLPHGRPTRREWRLLAATGLSLLAVIEVVVALIPADGPIGSTRGASDPWVVVIPSVVVVAMIVNALRRGRRWAWSVAVALAVLNVLALGSLLVSIAGGAESDTAGLNMAAGILWAAELTALLVGRYAFAVPGRRVRARGFSACADPVATQHMLRRYGGGSLSWMSMWPDNRTFVSTVGDGLLAYQRHAGVVIGLGDPIGPPAHRADTVREFAARADRIGAVPALFSVGSATRDVTSAMGWRHVQVAQDTLVDLPGLEFRGKKWQDVRSALNRAKKEGISFQLVVLADQAPSIIDQVRRLSQEWVQDKGLPEMGFTLGGVREALDREVRVALALDGDGTVHGMTSWLPVYGADGRVQGWTLDLMRRRANGFRPVVEFLIASSCQAFAAQGAEFVSLSGAPLARADEGVDSHGDRAGVDRLLDVLGANLEPLYGFRSLHAFKSKFSPRYEPMYLAYRDEADLPRIGVAITRAYLPGVRTSELLRLFARSGH